MARALIWFLTLWLLIGMIEGKGKDKKKYSISFKKRPGRAHHAANKTTPSQPILNPNVQLDVGYEKLLDTAIILIKTAKGIGPSTPDVEQERLEEDEGPEEDGDEKVPRCTPKPIDCEELLLECGFVASGVYRIYPRSRTNTWGVGGFEVYCDMETDGGGWTVIQKRDDFGASQDYFYKDWEHYKEGFGDLNYDYWIGNDKIFGLSNQRRTALRFDLQDFEDGKGYAVYDDFYIDDESEGYRLHIGAYRGDVGDSFSAHNQMKFSTKDRKNDRHRSQNCAQQYSGAWWFDDCHTVHLNGLYLKKYHPSYANGVNWYAYKGFHYSLKRTEMKLRSSDFARIFNPVVARQESFFNTTNIY